MNEEFDFLVIGGGSAGYAAAAQAHKLGLKTAVVEGGEQVGGLCILRGCMPSKSLLESGYRAGEIRRAAEFGIRATYEGMDPTAIRDRKRKLIGEFADYRRGQLEDGRFTFIRGNARFENEHEILIHLREGGERRVRAKSFLIATGSVVNCPPMNGLEEAGYINSDDVLDSDHIPKSIIVLGGGAIALELASYYAGVGSKVTVIQRSSHVLKEMDTDVAEAVTEGLEAHGIKIHRDTKITQVSGGKGQKRIEFLEKGKPQSVEAEEILCALGRRPNLDHLALERAGINAGKHPWVTTTQQTSVRHIFAAGDVCGPHEIVHLAVQQGEFAARNAARLQGKLSGELEAMDYALKLFAVFSNPKVAAVGLMEHEAELLCYDFLSAKYLFADHGKALIRGETHGFVKLIVAKDTRRILGGAAVGPEASELIHEIAVAMYFGATAGDLMRVPHYHPTLSEIWTYPAEELAGD